MEGIERNRPIPWGWAKAIVLVGAWSALLLGVVSLIITNTVTTNSPLDPLWLTREIVVAVMIVLVGTAVIKIVWRLGSGVSTARWLADFRRKTLNGSWMWIINNDSGGVQHIFSETGMVLPLTPGQLAIMFPFGGPPGQRAGFFIGGEVGVLRVMSNWGLKLIKGGDDIFIRISDPARKATSVVTLPTAVAFEIIWEVLCLQRARQTEIILSDVVANILHGRDIHRWETENARQRIEQNSRVHEQERADTPNWLRTLTPVPPPPG